MYFLKRNNLPARVQTGQGSDKRVWYTSSCQQLEAPRVAGGSLNGTLGWHPPGRGTPEPEMCHQPLYGTPRKRAYSLIRWFLLGKIKRNLNNPKQGMCVRISKIPHHHSKANSSYLLISNSRCVAQGKGWSLQDGWKFDYETRMADHLER